jgi:hypothetical protein
MVSAELYVLYPLGTIKPILLAVSAITTERGARVYTRCWYADRALMGMESRRSQTKTLQTWISSKTCPKL